MKIVHIITRLILGGAQENTLLSVEGQQDDWGDDVTLITGPALGPEGSLLDRAQRGGRQVRILDDLRRELHPGRDWRSYRTLRAWLRDLQPHIVHTHSSKAGVLGRAAAWNLGLPTVHTIHGAPFHAWQSPLAWQAYRACEWWAARRCDRLISVCDAMTEQYVAARVARPAKFVTVYSGMEVEPFLNSAHHRETMRRELGFGRDDLVVMKIARLFDLKGHADVIDAARRVADFEPRVKFVFVGDGLLREQLLAQIRRDRLEDRFLLTGLIPPERIPQYLAAADLVVHASLREGLARVLPQALLAGKPVVCYDLDGAREVVQTGRTGVLVPARDITALAAGILDLAQRPALRAELGAAGRELCRVRFCHREMNRQLRDIYVNVIARRTY
ncbi:MAG: glycosyltransferase family 4 protein [Planctomycetaceae bacterium]